MLRITGFDLHSSSVDDVDTLAISFPSNYESIDFRVLSYQVSLVIYITQPLLAAYTYSTTCTTRVYIYILPDDSHGWDPHDPSDLEADIKR